MSSSATIEQWITTHAFYFTLGSLAIGTVALIVSIVALRIAIKAYRGRRPPVAVELELHESDAIEGWHRCVVGFRNELTVAVDVVEMRSTRRAGMLICVGTDDGRIPSPDFKTFTVRLLPRAWRIPPMTDRWGDLSKTIFVLRPTSMRFGRRPRAIQLEMILRPLGGQPCKLRLAVTTQAIRWS